MTITHPSDLLKKYSPCYWNYTVQNPERAYYAECPTVYECAEQFRIIDVSLWLQAQVLALFGSSPSDKKGVSDGISIFCDSFINEVMGYKLSELMLFFARYKAGKYDNSYSTFDPRRIGNAFFKEFLPDRQKEIGRFERRRVQEEIEKRRFVPPEGYSSLSWYNELKKRAANGDKEAEAELRKAG